MIEYNYAGFRAFAITEIKPKDYEDQHYRKQTKHERSLYFEVSFFNYKLGMPKIVFVKSCIQYFLQASWKRSSKIGAKIELDKSILLFKRENTGWYLQIAARQKDNKSYLFIGIVRGQSIIDQMYLDVQEAMMIDIVLSKMINLISPKIFDYSTDLDEYDKCFGPNRDSIRY